MVLEQEAVWQSTALAGEVWLSPTRAPSRLAASTKATVPERSRASST